MDWSRFQTYGEAPDRAFEAFTSVLFERWCRQEYGAELERFIFVNGAGGDGGTEACAALRDGSCVGLQAKWFPNPLGKSQISKIKKSFRRAVEVRPGLRRYVVVLPHDLSDSPSTKKQRVTERAEWNGLIEDLLRERPGVEIVLWGDMRLTELLADLGSDGFHRFWFQGSVVALDELRHRLERDKAGWLALRYMPDLHCVGKIEEELALHLGGIHRKREWRAEVPRVLRALSETQREVERLSRFQEFMGLEDAPGLLKSALGWIDLALSEETALGRAFEPGRVPPYPSIPEAVPTAEPLHRLVQVLEGLHPSVPGVAPTQPVQDSLQRLSSQWSSRLLTRRELDGLNLPVVFVGNPGSGKTHALAWVVERQLASGSPALLVRAKPVPETASWDAILAEAVGQPSWTHRDVLDALEAAAALSDVRRVASSKVIQESAPTRVLIAIDGLEESGTPHRWLERLGELAVVSPRWPRLVFAFSTRPNLGGRRQWANHLRRVPIHSSSASLEEIFLAHCKANAIHCPARLRWALRTPLAIRLFAEEYRGKDAWRVEPDSLSLESLLHRKIQSLEESICQASGAGWPEPLRPVFACLQAVVSRCLDEGRPITSEEALDAVEAHSSPSGVLPRDRLFSILNQCSDWALLLRTEVDRGDVLRPASTVWEPAFEALTDYLLADQSSRAAIADPSKADVPRFLEHRFSTLVMAVALLGNQGFRFCDSHLWANHFEPGERQRIQLRALSLMTHKRAAEYADFVRHELLASMPTCRQTLEEVVLPGLRVAGWPFGARFVHEILLPLEVATRDLFWSLPSHVPAEHEAPWAGIGPEVLETLRLADDDPWDTAPLLLAWGTTTVDNQNRRRIRAELANWGGGNVVGLESLLRATLVTNDPQMREDLLTAAYGAVSLARPDVAWLGLCEWLIDSFLAPGAPLQTHNVVMQHAVRGIVERVARCGVPLDALRLEYSRSWPAEPELLLPLKREIALREVSISVGVPPMDYDLARYVVADAIEPFFQRLVPDRAGTNGEDGRVSWLSFHDDVLEAFACGRIRKRAPKGARDLARNELLRRGESRQRELTMLQAAQLLRDRGQAARRSEPATSGSAGCGQEVNSEVGSALELMVNSLSPSEQPLYSAEASLLLERHRLASGLSSLSPRQFAFGFVSAFCGALGWSSERFESSETGDPAQRIPGPDWAISGRYYPSTHGARSSVSTFGEKYVWLARHELIGYLAARLPCRKHGSVVTPPAEPALMSDLRNPASDLRVTTSAADWDGLESEHLAPTVALAGASQIDLANDWVARAPLPDPKPLLFPSSQSLPGWARLSSWTCLQARISTVGPESQAQTDFLATCLLGEEQEVSLFVEDVCEGAYFDRFHLHEESSGVDHVLGSYVDPIEAIWAPWISEVEERLSYSTLGNRGEPVLCKMQKTTCRLRWNSPRGEDEWWMPSALLRRGLGVVSLSEGCFLDSSGNVVAFYSDIARGAYPIDGYSEGLLVRRDLFDTLLSERRLRACWGFALFRQPSLPLLQDEWPRNLLSWHGICTQSGKKLRTFELHKELERFGPRR